MIYAGDEWNTRFDAGSIPAAFYPPVHKRYSSDTKSGFYLLAAGEWFYLEWDLQENYPSTGSALIIYDQGGYQYPTPDVTGGWWNVTHNQNIGFDYINDMFYLLLRYANNGTYYVRLYYFNFSLKTWNYVNVSHNEALSGGLILYPEDNVGYFTLRTSTYTILSDHNDGQFTVFKINLTDQTISLIYYDNSFLTGLEKYDLGLNADETYLYVRAGYCSYREKVYFLTLRRSDNTLVRTWSTNYSNSFSPLPTPIGRGYFHHEKNKKIYVLKGNGDYEWNLHGGEPIGDGPSGGYTGFIFNITTEEIKYIFIGNYHDGRDTKNRFVGFNLKFSGEVEKVFQKDTGNEYDLSKSKPSLLLLTGGDFEQYSLHREIFNQQGINFRGINSIGIV